MKYDIPELNLFMKCSCLREEAFGKLPEGYTVRLCRRDELETWKVLALEEPQYVDYLTEYFDAVYADKADEFFERCLFVCDPQGKPVGTCFLWKAYGKIETIHWLHVLPEYEGLGLGRALLTEVLQRAKAEDFPIYLHTHPHCLRAVHLYNEFGFQLVTDPVVGSRSNDWEEAMKYLKLYMPTKYVEKLQFVRADEDFLQAARSSEQSEF